MKGHVQQTSTTTNPVRVSSAVPRAALAMGAVGAVVGGAGAAAVDIRKVKNDLMTREEAVTHIVKESAGTGIAVATGTAVAGMLRGGPVLSLVSMVAVATGTKYMWNKTFDGDPEEVVPPSTAATKATAKKK